MQKNLTQKRSLSLGKIWMGVIVAIFLLFVASYVWLIKIYQPLSPFWKTDAGLYLQVVFWSVCGGLVHLLIRNIDQLPRAGHDFDAQSLLYESIQLLLAPVIALITFSLLYTRVDNEVWDLGYIILSFVCGLLTVQFFGLFQAQEDDDWDSAISLTNEPLNTATDGAKAEFETDSQESWQDESYGFAVTSDLYISVVLEAYEDLDELKASLRDIGFNAVSVTVQKEEGEEIINARKMGDPMFPIFCFENLEEGSYVVRAMLSVKMRDHHIENLFDQQGVQLNGNDMELVMHLKPLRSTP